MHFPIHYVCIIILSWVSSEHYNLYIYSVELDLTRDNHAFLVLQPAVEAFFIVHASHLQSQSDKKDDPKEKPDPFR